MSFTNIVVMAGNQSLIGRIGGCAATLNVPDPMSWAQHNVFALVAHEDWITAWSEAEEAKTVNVNPDTGARNDVITDEMIFDAVQTARAALN